MANQLRIAIQPSPEQFSRMTHGVQVVISQTAQTEVRMMTQEPDDKGRMTLAFMFINRSDKALNVGPESIATASLAFMSYDRLMEEQRKREGRKKFGHFLFTLGNAMSAASAGTQYSSYNYGGSTSYGSYYGSGSVSTYNPYLAQRAQERAYALNDAHAEQMYQSFAINRSAIGSNLRSTTLMPMQQMQSQLTFEIPKSLRNQRKAAPFTITVTLGGDQHVLSGFFGPAGTLPQIEMTRVAVPEQPAAVIASTSPASLAPSPVLAARPAPTRSPAASTGTAAASIEAYHRGEYRGNTQMLEVLAKQGYAPAQNDLASMYLAGTEVERNYTQAFRLFRLAADQNMRDAQANLAWMYETGQGTKKDIALARRYYRRAADAGDEMAIAKISELDLYR
ncbi:MAG TPA: tetratricopeptide repeat protein [Novosphingobium sp.]|nr:tetratricopeptide repeat protein [Novosphingobium sp.]